MSPFKPPYSTQIKGKGKYTACEKIGFDFLKLSGTFQI